MGEIRCTVKRALRRRKRSRVTRLQPQSGGIRRWPGLKKNQLVSPAVHRTSFKEIVSLSEPSPRLRGKLEKKTILSTLVCFWPWSGHKRSSGGKSAPCAFPSTQPASQPGTACWKSARQRRPGSQNHSRKVKFLPFQVKSLFSLPPVFKRNSWINERRLSRVLTVSHRLREVMSDKNDAHLHCNLVAYLM